MKIKFTPISFHSHLNFSFKYTKWGGKKILPIFLLPENVKLIHYSSNVFFASHSFWILFFLKAFPYFLSDSELSKFFPFFISFVNMKKKARNVRVRHSKKLCFKNLNIELINDADKRRIERNFFFEAGLLENELLVWVLWANLYFWQTDINDWYLSQWQMKKFNLFSGYFDSKAGYLGAFKRVTSRMQDKIELRLIYNEGWFLGLLGIHPTPYHSVFCPSFHRIPHLSYPRGSPGRTRNLPQKQHWHRFSSNFAISSQVRLHRLILFLHQLHIVPSIPSVYA